MPDKTLGEFLHEAREAGNDGRDRPLILQCDSWGCGCENESCPCSEVEDEECE